MENSWIHLAKGQYPRQAHVAIPDGLKEEEISRGGFQGRVADLYRRNEPTGWKRVDGKFAPGDVDGEAIETSDKADPNGGPTALWYNDDLTVSVSLRSAPMPYYYRDSDGDTLYFVHRGEGVCETEFGPLEFRPGDYLVIPKGVTYRIAPNTTDNYFLVLESKDEIGFVSHETLGRHNPYDPDIIGVPEPTPQEAEPGVEYEVRVKRAGQITSFFFDTHPIDVVGWKGDLFPFRFHNTDFRPVFADRNHVPPTAFGLFRTKSWVICNFVPHPVQMDREAARLPYYHRNVDYDEIGFLHGGTLGGAPMAGTTIMWHPRGAVHGPGEEARAMAAAAWELITFDDLEAVNIDTVRPLTITPAASAALRSHVQLITGEEAK